MYKILRTLLFFFPAEGVHHFSMKGLKIACGWAPLRRLVTWACRPESREATGNTGTAATWTGTTGDGTGTTTRGTGTTTHGTGTTTDGTGTTGDGTGTTGDGAGTSLQRTVLGLPFSNPIGLGAGFDKNALYLRELQALGFGFVEIGTVTPKPQAGNDQPRLFRLPQDQALINRMGFNNDGVEVIASRLRDWHDRGDQGHRRNRGDQRLIIGGNIGKNKVTPNEDAWKDYEVCFRALYNIVDYFVVNVSSPNTPGLRELQEKESLRRILTNLQRVRLEFSPAGGATPRPLLLKIAPDLIKEQLDDVISLALEINLDGLVATNTTISRENLLTPADRLASIGAGGLSGAPLRERSTEVVRYLAEKTAGRIPIIASGGIFTAADAREKLAVGAALVQVWTGFIYEGPFIVNRICRDLPAIA